MDNGPINLNLQPPSSKMGCCGVRMWRATMAVLEIIYYSFIENTSCFTNIVFEELTPLVPLWFLLCIIVNVTLVIVNIRLRNGVLKRDIAPVQLWLQVNKLVFIVHTYWRISKSYNAFTSKDEFGNKRKRRKFTITLFILIADVVILAFCMYQVNEYYNFEQKVLTTKSSYI